MPITLTTLQSMKEQGEKFAVLTAYDSTFAYEISRAGVEAILVGDSLGMVLQGHDSTLPVTIDDIAYHVASVKRGASDSLIMADMPFMTYGSPDIAMDNAMLLMQSGAHMVKLEGGDWLCETVQMLSRQGVPVCVHLGLTPQSVNKLGGYKVQGRDENQAAKMIREAQALEEAGTDILLLECVPSDVAEKLTDVVKVPVIGIGAGPDTDAQVLVLHDLLGLGQGKRPRFVKDFLQENDSIHNALKAYVKAVKDGAFPSREHSFS